MHIFLQGPRGIGKSTAIQKAIALLSKSKPLFLGGFVTYKGKDSDSYIYISPAGRAGRQQAFRIARFGDGGISLFYPEVFDEQGVGLLQDTRRANLICMDELGFLESQAVLFQREVFACLDGKIPVLGALRDSEIPWHEPIKSHPSVSVLRINEDNRDTLPELICKKISLKG